MKALPTVYRVKMRHSEKIVVLEQKHLNTKELSLFTVILLYFEFGCHDNFENFLRVLLTCHNKCLPNFITLLIQRTEIWWIYYNFIIRRSLMISLNSIDEYSMMSHCQGNAKIGV